MIDHEIVVREEKKIRVKAEVAKMGIVIAVKETSKKAEAREKASKKVWKEDVTNVTGLVLTRIETVPEAGKNAKIEAEKSGRIVIVIEAERKERIVSAKKARRKGKIEKENAVGKNERTGAERKGRTVIEAEKRKMIVIKAEKIERIAIEVAKIVKIAIEAERIAKIVKESAVEKNERIVIEIEVVGIGMIAVVIEDRTARETRAVMIVKEEAVRIARKADRIDRAVLKTDQEAEADID